jgi:hypothetical protein
MCLNKDKRMTGDRVKTGIKLLSALLFVSLLWTILGSAVAQASGGVTVSLSPAEKSADAGETVTLDVKIDTGSTKIRGWQGGIVFDSEMLECTEVTEGEFLQSFGTETNASPFDEPDIDNDGGMIDHISYAIVSQTAGGVSGTGILCTLTFKVKEDAADSTEIDPVDVIIADKDALAIDNDAITLKGATISINPPSMGIFSETASIKTGASFDLEIKVDTSGVKSGGAGLSLAYDPELVSCKKVDPGSFYTGGSLDPEEPVIDDSEGTVEYFQVNLDDSSAEGKSGSGILCVFSMKAKSRAGTVTISIEGGTVLDSEGNDLLNTVVNPAGISIKIKSASTGGGGGGGGGSNPTTTTPVASPSPTPTLTLTPTPTITTPPVTSSTPTGSITTTTPATTGSSTPTATGGLPAPPVSSTPAPAKTTSAAPSPEATSAVPVLTTALPLVSESPSPVPTSTPGVISRAAGYASTSPFNLKEASDSNGTLHNDFVIEKDLNEDGSIGLKLQIENGTTALNRQRKPLESFTIDVIKPSAAIKQKIDPVVVFECGPSGSTFSSPVVVTIHYDPAALPKGVNESDLKLSVYNSKNVEWVVVDSKLDVVNHTLSAQADPISTFALIKKAGSGIPWVIFVVIGVVVIILAAGFVFWFTRRKKAAIPPK